MIETDAVPSIQGMDTKPTLCSRILILDDAPDAGELLGLVIEMLGYEVDVYTTAAQALGAIKRARLRGLGYWAFFCDYSMPRVPGDEVFREVKAHAPELARRFVFVTGMVGDARLLALARDEGRPVLWKPFTMMDVEQVLEHLTWQRDRTAEVGAVP